MRHFDKSEHTDAIDSIESIHTDLRCEIDSLIESDNVDDCLTFLNHLQNHATLLRDHARALAIKLNEFKNRS